MGLVPWILPWGCVAPGGQPTGTSQVVVVPSGRRPRQLRVLLEPELGLGLGQQTN